MTQPPTQTSAVDREARKYTKEYKEETGEAESETDKIFYTYKFQLTSQETIESSIRLVNDYETAKEYFQDIR